MLNNNLMENTAGYTMKWILVITMFLAINCFSFSVRGQNCNNIFISEYIEGTSFNKCIELFNPTSATIDLLVHGYSIEISFNGGSTVSNIPLTGKVNSEDVYVLCQNSAATKFTAKADQLYSSPMFNGNDAVYIVKGFVGTDIIGEIGVNPGNSWPVGSDSTQNTTMVRKHSVTGAQLVWSTGMNEWDTYPNDTDTFLGWHLCLCNDSLVGIVDRSFENNLSLYPNPANDYINLKGIDLAPGDITVQIFDILGREIESFNMRNVRSIVWPINIKFLDRGTYIIKVSSENTNIVKHFVKI